MFRPVMIATAVALALGAPVVAPAAADPHGHGGHGDGDDRERHDNGRHKGWDKHGGRGDDGGYARRGDDRRGDDQRGYDQRGYDARRDAGRGGYAYDYNRPDPRYGDYRAERYYRQGAYPERRLYTGDRIYRGGDGRYYCRRNDGTTGLVVGALGGGVLGNVIAPNGSKTLGAVLGALGGGLLGRGVDRGNVTCR